MVIDLFIICGEGSLCSDGKIEYVFHHMYFFCGCQKSANVPATYLIETEYWVVAYFVNSECVNRKPLNCNLQPKLEDYSNLFFKDQG